MTISTGNSYLDSLGSTKGSTTTTTKKSNESLSQNDFLKLLTTQMQTQDPFNPVDNTQMVAQMAQFSQTTGIAEMNQSLKSMVQSLQQSRVADAANWIGKAALLPSKAASALADGSFAGNVTLPDAASRVDISLVDGSGTVVYTGSATNVPAGDVPFYWDGKDQDGNPVAGPLTIVASAKDGEAKAMTDIVTSSWATVASVSSPASGSTKIVTPLGNFDPADALQLS
ncbi:flagellar hook capping protein [Sphingomonas histidinilytica]|jgi:flagellar basal-body rod modification protein FlgD|uniref:Basal-body rod modification protein FlgD n=1 Tax=Rhizorhabdus histidinilytica TaxID=439228 RepID=A0A1T5BZJ6_9SPHN|nr:flagellar hook capping FlgD N-terminal domain-containing protein [Rhizorhabdus histidinilytica]MBO9375229.1 flagellar hook capping protein [Rhizorhabdus histidinilytica]QEH77392.1 flagellar hook capping protein [Sphingomonas sp. C8-2]SKB52587.1 flagellar basal-body rod modification protein FlgD [Rhizorhabdus histidinilytica]